MHNWISSEVHKSKVDTLKI